MYPIHAFGSGGAAPRLAARARHRRQDRLLRPHRARLRVESRRHDHASPRDRRRLGAQRHQDVDHQRLDGRCGGDLGADRKPGDTKGIRGFVVPTDTPGFSARDQKGKLSLLASDTSELVLDDVRLPHDAILPGSDRPQEPADVSHPGPLRAFRGGRWAPPWPASTRPRATPASASCSRGVIAGKQIQQVRLADMLTAITQGQLLCPSPRATQGPGQP